MNVIRIETTNCCNLKCTMCPQSNKTKGVARGLMKPALFKTIVDQVGAFPENRNALFYLHICGEPLLHPQIVELIGHAAGRGFKPILTTNATLLSPELAGQLVRSGLHKIEFSFEGFDAATYEAIRVGAKFNAVLRHIDGFLEANKAAGHTVRTELVIVDLPEVASSRIASFREEMAPRFDQVHVSGYFDWLGRVPGPEYTKERYVGCSVTGLDLNVLWDGRVVPCCLDVDGGMVIGNFNRQCFVEVWSARARRALEERLKRGDLAGLPCERCVVPWNARQVRSQEKKVSPVAERPAVVAV